jgi:Uncharacterized conserved protein
MRKLTCHCGEVEAEINVPDQLIKKIRCNCSICKRKGAIMSIVKNEDFKIIKGKEKLKCINFTQKQLSIFFVSIVVLHTS